MDVKEICAEKIRAASGRARYRDFYDLCLLINRFEFDLKELKELINCKEMRRPITYASMVKNWHVARKQRAQELERVYYAEEVKGNDIEKVISRLADL